MANENYKLTQTGAEVQRILDSVESFDITPTQNSTKPVTSGGIYTAVQAANSGIANEASTRATADTNLQNAINFINKSLGKYDSIDTQTLTQATAGKYVNVNGTETSASGYGISSPFTLKAGDILLVPSAEAVPASVSVVARIVTRTFDKVINYGYTYRQDYPELPATATADYDDTLVYTALYDETGETPVLTGWSIGGQTITTLPTTHEVTESYYEPLVKQSVSAMPGTGFYVYLCPVGMTVVVSGLTATVNGGVAQIVGWGIFKNICSNFVGAPGQSVIAQAFAQQQAEIDGLKAQLANLGDARANSVDSDEYLLASQPMLTIGEGAPTSYPWAVKQMYFDKTNRVLYIATNVTASTSDWVALA